MYLSQLDNNAAVVVGCGFGNLEDTIGHPYRIQKQDIV